MFNDTISFLDYSMGTAHDGFACLHYIKSKLWALIRRVWIMCQWHYSPYRESLYKGNLVGSIKAYYFDRSGAILTFCNFDQKMKNSSKKREDLFCFVNNSHFLTCRRFFGDFFIFWSMSTTIQKRQMIICLCPTLALTSGKSRL